MASIVKTDNIQLYSGSTLTITPNTAISGTLNVTGATVLAALSATTGTFTGLTSGRIPVVSTGGLLIDDSGLTFNTTTNALTATTFIGALTGDVTGNVTGNISGTTGTFSSLTSGRVALVTTGGLLADDADLTFSINTLTAHTLVVSTGALTVTGGSIKLTATGEITAGTSDASDNAYVSICGGGALSTTRGAAVIAYGNENANTGQLRLAAGDVANGDVFSQTAGLTRFVVKRSGSVLVGDEAAALATTATDGFLYVPTCAGTPTGTPTAITGVAPIVINTSQNKLYFYSGGAWRDAGP